MGMITEIQDYFDLGCGRCERFATADCSTKKWHAGLARLREVCLEMGLSEEVKWGHPCYVHGGRNIAIIGAFREGYRLAFFNAALMKDPEGVLEREGPKTKHAGTLRFTDNSQVGAMARTVRAYLGEAIGYADAGTKAPREAHELDLPEEMVEAMDADPELAEAFQALTPGRQRSYEILLKGAKKSETRVARIAKFRAKIIEGKGATER
jgi:uncharacterized protein YdeI (YjbR/CyaY-like superfamily)